ncbi:MAG: hypothetical protein MUO94_06570, partial [Thermoplasmata archaeon]|nr:hypothetical protein [Thermoplasmata archaeon]
MNDRSSAFLEDLCNCFGPSGFEKGPARMVRDYVGGYSDEVFSDNLGSLLFSKKGSADRPV